MSSPDQGIKKVIIAKKDLPALFGKTSQYIVKYRIVSEDKNRTSHWSPQYKLDAPEVINIEHSASANTELNIVNVVWNAQPDMSAYDVYIKWENEGWMFLSTVSTTSYSFLIKAGATGVQIAVQVPTFPKERFTQSTLFETELISL
jgi:hypothetical protein